MIEFLLSKNAEILTGQIIAAIMDIQLENKFFNFDNYNILILGGNSGFGFEILKLFSKYNNKIFIKVEIHLN